MFDRVGHFIIWFYAFPIVELVLRKKCITNNTTAYLFALFSIISIAWIYEIFEWVYALYLDPASWGAVLGSQWDVWDAQKDILMDTLGAISILVFHKIYSSIYSFVQFIKEE